METVLNEQYEKLINKLYNVLDYGVSGEAKSLINDVIFALQQLGQRIKCEKKLQQFMDITTDMAKTYADKNHDYGDSFEQSLYEFGLIASIVRMGDKMNRIKSLSKKEAEVKDESIKDTLLDLANYAVMTVMWLNRK